MVNKIKEIFKKAWDYVYKTKVGKLISSSILAIISFILDNVWDFMHYVGLAFLIYPTSLFLVMMADAWVINPIKDWKESQKAKKEAKEHTIAVAKKIIEIKNNLNYLELESDFIKKNPKKTLNKTTKKTIGKIKKKK